jgi:hypothetical protein
VVHGGDGAEEAGVPGELLRLMGTVAGVVALVLFLAMVPLAGWADQPGRHRDNANVILGLALGVMVVCMAACMADQG